jgi:hypothetical protein
MESLPEATIDVAGGASELQIEGLGVKKTKDSLSAGTTSSTAALSTEDFFADLIADTNFKDPQSVFSFRNNAIQRIVETDPAILSSLTQPDTATPPPSSSSFSPSPATSSVSGFDTLFGQGGGDGLDSDSFGSFDSVGFSGDSSGVSSSGFDTATSDYTGAEKAGMAGAVSSALGVGIGLASGRDYTDVDLAASAAGLAGGTIGEAYGAYSTYSDLAASFGRGDFGISQGLAGVNGAIGAIGAISDVADAISSGKDFSSIAEEAFDSALGFAQGAWSAITDPAAAVEAFTEYSTYGSLNATNLSYSLPSGQVSYSINSKTGQLNTPGFISLMMSLTPLSNAFSLAQKGMSFSGYTASISDRATAFGEAFSTTPGIGFTDANTAADIAAATGVSATAYGTFGQIADFSISVPGFADVSIQADLSALADVALASLSLNDVNQAAVVQAFTNSFEEEEAYNESLASWGRSMAEAYDLGENATGADLADAISDVASVGASAFSDAMESFGYSFSSVGLTDEAAATSSQGAANAEAAFANANLAALTEEAKASFTNAAGEFGISDYNAAYSLAATAAMDELASTTDIAFESVSVTLADLTAEEIANMVATTMSQEAGQGPDPGGIEGVDWGDFEGGSMDPDGNFSYNSINDFATALATSFQTGWFGYPGTPAGARGGGAGGGRGGPGGTAGVDAEGIADAVSTSVADAFGAAFDVAAEAAQASLDGPGGGDYDGLADGIGANEAEGGIEDSGETGGPGGDCFVQGTLVLMAEGSTKAIEKVVVGDLVAGKDGKANKVKATHIKKPDIPFLYGFNGHKPFVTAYHPFMTKEGWGCFEPEKFKDHRPAAYQEIANEQGGKDLIKIENDCELLRSDNQWVLVEDIIVEGCDPDLTVYNLSVANDKTFVANNYIVHNKECFIPTAQVTMFDGSNKQIKDIKVGDKVMSVDGEANTVIATPVFNLGANKIHGFNGKQPFVTSMHPILTKEGWKNFNPKAYKESWPEDYEKVASENADGVIHEITEKDELAWKSSRDGVTYITFKDPTVLHEDSNFKVYNLTLDGDHTFVVEGLVVHNKGKIICTAMNQMYGFGSYRNALWMKYQKSHMAAEEYELGYHKLVMPLVKKMPTNKVIRTALERIAKRRTINIRKELRGQKLPLYYRSMKYTVRPLFFAVGWLVKKKILSKVKI